MPRARPRATLDDALRARALTVLGAPASALECATSASALAALAEFLEDTVIRALPADQRDGLRRARTADARGVRDALTAYGEHLEPALEALGEGALDAVADELLERATALKHADAAPSPARDDVEAIERSSKRLKLFSRDADEVSGALASDAGWEALTRLATALGAETNGTGGGRDPLDACVLLERCVVAQERFVTAFASASGRETAMKSAEAGGHAERGRTERRRRSGARRRRRSVIARERSAEVTERSGCVFGRHARVHRRSQDGFPHRKGRTIVGASRSRFNSHPR